MARIRTIKPDFFTHEELFLAEKDEKLPLRIAFAGIWTVCDREGRFKWRPNTIKLSVLPFDNVDFSRVLDALASRDFIVQYMSNDGEIYGFVPSFVDHQVINNREAQSLIPSPFDACVTRDPRGLSKNQGKGREGKGREGKGNGVDDALKCPIEKIVSLYHEKLPNNPVCKVVNESRKSSIKARWEEAAKLSCSPFGYSTIEDGINSWAKFFEVCSYSDFLTGNVNPAPGKTRFFADIDFLFSPSGFAKCLENKYHRETV